MVVVVAAAAVVVFVLPKSVVVAVAERLQIELSVDGTGIKYSMPSVSSKERSDHQAATPTITILVKVDRFIDIVLLLLVLLWVFTLLSSSFDDI